MTESAIELGYPADAAVAVKRVKAATSLPVAVGFGIKSEGDASAIAKIADAAVVGSALVAEISRFVDEISRVPIFCEVQVRLDLSALELQIRDESTQVRELHLPRFVGQFSDRGHEIH